MFWVLGDWFDEVGKNGMISLMFKLLLRRAAARLFYSTELLCEFKVEFLPKVRCIVEVMPFLNVEVTALVILWLMFRRTWLPSLSCLYTSTG